MSVSPAGFTTAALTLSAMPTKAPPMPAGREPTEGGAQRQPAKSGSFVWAASGEAQTSARSAADAARIAPRTKPLARASSTTQLTLKPARGRRARQNVKPPWT